MPDAEDWKRLLSHAIILLTLMISGAGILAFTLPGVQNTVVADQ